MINYLTTHCIYLWLIGSQLIFDISQLQCIYHVYSRGNISFSPIERFTTLMGRGRFPPHTNANCHSPLTNANYHFKV